MSIRRIEPGPRMVQASVYNGVVYLAGQVGAPGKSVTEQTTAILAEIDRLLKEAGTDKSRLLQAIVWLADMADYNEMNAVWDAWVAAPYGPGRATVQAKMFSPDYRVEMIVTAAV